MAAWVSILFGVILTERFPPEVQDVGLSFANLLQWSLNLLLSAFFLPLQEAIGQAAVFFIFGLFGLFSTVLFAWFLPETQGSTKRISIVEYIGASESQDEIKTLSPQYSNSRSYDSATEPSINY